MTRQEKILKGKLWTVHFDNCDNNLFEGTKTACHKYLKENNLTRQYKRGKIRVGQLIWEFENE